MGSNTDIQQFLTRLSSNLTIMAKTKSRIMSSITKTKALPADEETIRRVDKIGFSLCVGSVECDTFLERMEANLSLHSEKT